jgi:amidohydrolase
MSPRDGSAARPIDFEALASTLEARVVAWRRDFHQHPELGNREHRTAGIVAAHLRSLGLEVTEGVAHTGVVGLLRGARPGPTVALRADMDALPVEEQVDLPFASRARTQWGGMDCGVMHACGHDAHTAMLMGVAELLAEQRSRLAGNVKFLFQPAEEGAPPGEEGGAQLMIDQGCMESPKVGAVFGLHVTSNHETGKLGYRSGPLMASSDELRIFVQGEQTHGAMPWRGVDPIVVGSQIVVGLQTIVSRRLDVTREPSVVTVGVFQGGNRDNIIPDEVRMEGTIRTFDEGMRADIHRHVKHITEMIAAAGGARARVQIKRGYDVVVNDPALTAFAVPVLGRVAGEANVGVVDKVCGAEDFAFFQKVVPGVFIRVGCRPRGTALKDAAPNHSPRFFVDEDCLALGVKALAALATDWLEANAGRESRR